MKKEKFEIEVVKKYIPITTGKQFAVLADEAYQELKSINYIQCYDKKYITVTGYKNFVIEKKMIKQMYQRNMFNIIDYINPHSKSFTIYISEGRQLERIFKKIEEDIENGYYPFQYSVYLGINTDNIKRSNI